MLVFVCVLGEIRKFVKTVVHAVVWSFQCLVVFAFVFVTCIAAAVLINMCDCVTTQVIKVVSFLSV